MNNIEIQLNPRDFKDVEVLSVRSVEETLWINTVFNINREGNLPARFLRGFLPALKLSEKIKDLSDGKITPAIRIFEPRNFSSCIDGIDDTVADHQQSLAFQTISSLARKHFPLSCVRFEVDERVTEDAMDILFNVASLIDVSEQGQDLINRLKMSGRKWGGELGEDKSLIYAAHHPFGWSDLHHEALFKEKPPRTVVNLLPPSERKFTLIRAQILSGIINTDLARLVSGGDNINLPLNICGAHYIPVKDEQGRIIEPTFEKARFMKCGDIIDQMENELLAIRSGSVKSNLKKALVDIKTFMEDLSGVRIEDVKGVVFSELIGEQK